MKTYHAVRSHPSHSIQRSGVFSVSTNQVASLSANAAPNASVGQMAAQLYERKCHEKNISVNPFYRDRLLAMGDHPLIPISDASSANKGIVGVFPSQENSFASDFGLDFSDLDVDESFDIVLDLLLMSSSSEVNALNCSNMHLQNNHVQTLAERLFHCPTVRKIDISLNSEVTDRGGEQLFVLLKHRKARGFPLLQIKIQGTGISPELASAIMAEVPQRGVGPDFSKFNHEKMSVGSGNLQRNRSSLAGDEIFDRGCVVVRMIFGSLDRVLGVLCWEPPLRTLAWFALCLSFGLTGISLETVGLIVVIVLWHKRNEFISRVPADRSHTYPQVISPGGHASFRRWRRQISEDILEGIASPDSLARKESLLNAFSVLEFVILTARSDFMRRWTLASLCAFSTICLLFIPFHILCAILTSAVFLWDPIISPFLRRMQPKLGRAGSRIRLAFAVLLGLEKDPIAGERTSVIDTLKSRQFVVQLLSLESADGSSRSFLSFNPLISIFGAAQSWVSPQLADYGEYVWGDEGTSPTFTVGDSGEQGKPVIFTFSLLGNTIQAGRPEEELSSLAQGHAIIDASFLSKLPVGGALMRIQLKATQQPPNIVKDLLDSIFAFESMDRERFNVPLQSTEGLRLGPSKIVENSGSRALPPMSLFLKVRAV